MGKSLGNFITLEEFFTGKHSMLEKAYSPMTVRFFILQAHYRSTVDFSNEALQASEKGLDRLMQAVEKLDTIHAAETSSVSIREIITNCYEAMNDDLNTPILISYLFELVKLINSAADGKQQFNSEDLDYLKLHMNQLVFEVLGLARQEKNENQAEDLNAVMNLLLQLRVDAKNKKDWETADKIRNELSQLGFVIKDKKDGFEWSKE